MQLNSSVGPTYLTEHLPLLGTLMRLAWHSRAVTALGAASAASILACSDSRVRPSKDLPPRVRGQLELTRSRRYEASLASTKAYLATVAGSERGEERCAMLVVAAFSEAILQQRPEGEAHLTLFERECSEYPLRYGWHAEARRVRRVLDGEAPTTVYSSARTTEAR
jgi:hypothetical protein